MKNKLFIFLFSLIVIFSGAKAQNINVTLLRCMGPRGSKGNRL